MIPTPHPALKEHYGNDEWVLTKCAEWRMARAQMQKNWAAHDLANGWGTLPDAHIELDREPLARMHEIESLIDMCEPRTILLARELLGICVTILAFAYEDPEGALAEGPVLEIVRNVISSLDHMKAEMRIGPKSEQPDD
jgi:hypothetical protein